MHGHFCSALHATLHPRLRPMGRFISEFGMETFGRLTPMVRPSGPFTPGVRLNPHPPLGRTDQFTSAVAIANSTQSDLMARSGGLSKRARGLMRRLLSARTGPFTSAPGTKIFMLSSRMAPKLGDLQAEE